MKPWRVTGVLALTALALALAACGAAGPGQMRFRGESPHWKAEMAVEYTEVWSRDGSAAAAPSCPAPTA